MVVTEEQQDLLQRESKMGAYSETADGSVVPIPKVLRTNISSMPISVCIIKFVPSSIPSLELL